MLLRGVSEYMINEFKNKKEFQEEFKRRIIERYGRSIEPVSYTHLDVYKRQKQ